MRLLVERKTLTFDPSFRVIPLDSQGQEITSLARRLDEGARYRFRPSDELLKAMGLEEDAVTVIGRIGRLGQARMGFSRIDIRYRLPNGPIIEEQWDAMSRGRPDWPIESYDLKTPPIEMDVEMEWADRDRQ